MNYGVQPEGFVKKPLDIIEDELDADLKGILGDSAGTEVDGSIPPSGFAGQVKTLIADMVAAQWDGQQAVVASWDPRKNGDAAQDATCALVGVVRLGSEQSTVVVTCTGDPGTILQPLRVVAVPVAGSRFDSNAIATIAALTAWAGTTGYAVGARVTNGGNAYVCITSGTSAGSGGPTTTAADITDGTVHWRFMGVGTGAVDVAYTAEIAGPIGATSGALTDIKTPVSGWRGAINLLDATVGRVRESNATLRARRDAELQADAEAVPDAIRSHILKVGENTNNPVLSCRVFYNDTDDIDADGLPPHSVEALVRGGEDQDVANALFAVVDAGSAFVGNTSVTVVDDNGQSHTVKFTRPTLKPIWIIANVTYDPLTFPTADLPSSKLALAKQIVFYGDTYPVGRSVRSTPLEAQLFDGNVDEVTPPTPGVQECTSFLIGLSNPPVASTTIAIAARELATFDTSRVTINLTAGTPGG